MNIRGMDMDDFILLALVGRGLTVSDSAWVMALTQPAVSNRLRKIEGMFSVKIIERKSRSAIASPQAEHVFKMADDALLAIVGAIPDAFRHFGRYALVHNMLGKPRNWAAEECNRTKPRRPRATCDVDSPIGYNASNAVVYP